MTALAIPRGRPQEMIQISDIVATIGTSGAIGAAIGYLLKRVERKDSLQDKTAQDVTALESKKIDDLATIRLEIAQHTRDQESKLEKLDGKYEILYSKYNELTVKYGVQEAKLIVMQEAVIDIRDRLTLITTLDRAKQHHEIEQLIAHLSDRMNMMGITTRRSTDPVVQKIVDDVIVMGAHEAQPKGTSPDMFSEQTDLNGPTESGENK